MKSRKVKAAAKSKLYISKKKLKGDIPIGVESDSGPDIDSDSYYHDDIDDYHKQEDEKLSTDDELIQYDDDTSEEEEVLPIITDDEDENDDKSEAEEDSIKDENEGLPNPEAWGRKKSLYYNADFVDEDRGRTYREEDAEAAKAEAEEAFAIQKNIFCNIAADNLGADLLFEGSAESSGDEEEKVCDLGSASKQEKLKFLRKTSPELFVFIREFKEKMKEVKNKIEPLLSLIVDGQIPSEDCINYIKLKYHLLLHYCMNISFYMVLRSSGIVVTNHPVLQRITSYKKLLDNLKNIDESIEGDINIILEKLKNNEEICFTKENPVQSETESQNGSCSVENSDKEETKKSKKRKMLETDAEKEIISLYRDLKDRHKKKPSSSTSEQEMDVDPVLTSAKDISEEKRTVTYQIAKNKGLVPHRKKEYRNPRVRHRMKYRKAKIRRKGQVREVVREIKKYEGEPTGISTHVVKSIKLK